MPRKKIVPTEWAEYLELIAPASEWTQAQVAERVLSFNEDAFIEQTTVSKWRRGLYTPRAAVVSSVAEAFGREPLEALVAVGLVDINWVKDSLSSNALATLKKIGIEPTRKRASTARS